MINAVPFRYFNSSARYFNSSPRCFLKTEASDAPPGINLAELLVTDVETKFKSFPAKVVTKMVVLIEEEIIFAHRHGDYHA